MCALVINRLFLLYCILPSVLYQYFQSLTHFHWMSYTDIMLFYLTLIIKPECWFLVLVNFARKGKNKEVKINSQWLMTTKTHTSFALMINHIIYWIKNILWGNQTVPQCLPQVLLTSATEIKVKVNHFSRKWKQKKLESCLNCTETRSIIRCFLCTQHRQERVKRYLLLKCLGVSGFYFNVTVRNRTWCKYNFWLFLPRLSFFVSPTEMEFACSHVVCNWRSETLTEDEAKISNQGQLYTVNVLMRMGNCLQIMFKITARIRHVKRIM